MRIGSFMISAGNALLSNIPVLFAVGVALGMSKERDGSAALSGLVAYLVITKVLGPEKCGEFAGNRNGCGKSRFCQYR